MSGPTRGMVAGQAIQTQAQTKEFDEGYERVFGKGSKECGRFVWSEEQKAMVPVGQDWTDAERRAGKSEEELYGHATTADGVDISSRRKRRDYMRATGVTDASDFSKEYVEGRKKDATKEQDRQRRADIVESYKRWKGY